MNYQYKTVSIPNPNFSTVDDELEKLKADGWEPNGDVIYTRTYEYKGAFISSSVSIPVKQEIKQ